MSEFVPTAGLLVLSEFTDQELDGVNFLTVFFFFLARCSAQQGDDNSFL